MKFRFKISIIIFILIISIIFPFLTACNKKVNKTEHSYETDSITEDMYEKATNVYKVKEFDLPDDFYYDSYNKSFDDYFYIYGFIDSNYTQLKYDLNGELIDNINLTKLTDIKYSALLAGMQSNGNYVIITFDAICLISSDGDIITKHDYTYEYSNYLFISENDEVYFTNGRTLYVFDNNLELVTEIVSSNTLSTIFSDKDNNIIIKNHFENTYNTLDIQNKIFKKYDKIKLEQNSQLFFGFDNNEYIMDDKGVYINDDKITPLLNWENSALLYMRTKNHMIINENIILCELKDFFDTIHKPVILQRVPDDEVEKKIIINLAIMGFDNVGIITEAIALFNRENKNYRITTTDYTVFDKAPSYDQSVNEFNKDLLNGNHPDIVMIHFTMFNDIDTYTDKNVFIDLTDAIHNSEHKLLKCVESAYCNSDKIYQIPIFMQLETILTKTSIIGENESFTLDKLYSLADNIKDNEALFSKPIDLINTAIYDFIDYENKTCSFETDEFIRLLEFQKNMNEYVDKEKGAINNFTNNYFLTSDKLYDSLANDELYFLNLPFDKLSGYLISKICYGDDDFTICGYPTSKGKASMLKTEYTFGITEQSKVKNGAWEFIEFLLSETIQNSETLTSYGLPVTIDGIKKLIDTYVEYYFDFYQTDDVNNSQYSGDVSIIGRGVSQVLPDNHPNRIDADYVVTVTEEDKQKLLDFFNSTDVKSYTDDTVSDIVNEEYGQFYADSISAQETAKRIQNRIFIYLNE